MSRPSDAKTRLIKAATHLFRRRGYNGVGLTELLDASGSPKGSFYHHFPGGKEQLAEATVIGSGHDMSYVIDQAFTGVDTLEQGAHRLVAVIADAFVASDYTAGCPVTSILLDTVTTSQMHKKAGEDAFDMWRDVLDKHAKRLGDPRDVDALALALLVAIEGGWVVGRIRRDIGPVLIAGDALRMVKAPS